MILIAIFRGHRRICQTLKLLIRQTEPLLFSSEFTEDDGGQQLNILGSFSVPIRDFHMSTKEIVHQFKDGSREDVAAVVSGDLGRAGV